MSGKMLMKGNIAIAEGAIDAGCRFYAGYPITPQNEIPEYMSKRMPEAGGVFMQAESELISINLVFGASVAGARSMTTSSSPGMSLMQEGISYMAGCELPGVIVNVMRGGPGLGNIAPSQSDYFQAVKPGHGDFRMITLAPSNIQEMYDFTFEAFDLADKYRNPVMILTDGLLGQMMETIELSRGRKPLNPRPASEWALTGAKGREPRKILSLLMKPGELEQHNYDLWKKYDAMKKTEIRYEFNAEEKDYDCLIVAFGSVARTSKGVIAEGKDIKAALFRPVTLWPFPYEQLREAAKKAKKVFVFEMNMGQMVEDVRLAVQDDSKVEFFGRPGGGLPSQEELLSFLRKKVK
ncbi:MAG: 2-oxoglutarate oxidoreductase subunit KorA [Candidatus Aerophobetes bacterium ADurb.Bin490]|nr:MAG: 2-oxoglutarate oxidoreductase subunit KorA [Candidatus Aerophobetes bacterium ADurb.Bin490]HNZ29191.1 3-methyl-2-oxobutanoate dehydrogenase subunit VorB [Candidatus Goldiibacteriota bacterium]